MAETPFPNPSFSQQQSRSLLIPALIAAVVLVAAFIAAKHFLAAEKVNLTLLHTEVLDNTSVFKSNSIVIAPEETQHTLLVASTVRIENQRQQQIFLDDFNLTLTDSTGAQMAVKAVTRQDLPNLLVEFPKLKPLVAKPLMRDTPVDPGKSAEGTLVFSLPLPQSYWDQRQSAELTLDVYHGHPVSTTIPK